MSNDNKTVVTVTYTLADGRSIEIEVAPGVALALEETDRKTRALLQQDKRHLDLAGYVEGETETALFAPHQDVADIVDRLETYAQLHKAIGTLPEKQRRRVKAYFFDGLTCRQIADVEGVRHQSISKSINQALHTLKESL